MADDGEVLTVAGSEREALRAAASARRPFVVRRQADDRWVVVGLLETGRRARLAPIAPPAG